MSTLIGIDRRDAVLYVTLQRSARRDALSLQLLAALRDTFLNEVHDSTAIIITGAGGVFSAGADFTELAGTSKDQVMDDAIAKVVAAIRAVPVAVIAAIDGPCIRGAVDIALACDLRVASADAYFQIPATRLGLLYNPAAVKRMFKLLSRHTLTRLLLLGERFDAQEALAAGLLSYALTDGSSVDTATGIARRAEDNLGAAVAATKELFNALESGDFDATAWEEKRRQILDPPGRAAAITAARKKVKTTKGDGNGS